MHSSKYYCQQLSSVRAKFFWTAVSTVEAGDIFSNNMTMNVVLVLLCCHFSTEVFFNRCLIYYLFILLLFHGLESNKIHPELSSVFTVIGTKFYEVNGHF